MGCADTCSVGGSQHNQVDSTLASLQLSSAYTQYKYDNAKIANWLGRAALSNGYPRSDLIHDRSPHVAEEADPPMGRGEAQSAKAAKRARAKADARARAAGLDQSKDQSEQGSHGRAHGHPHTAEHGQSRGGENAGGHGHKHHAAGHAVQKCCQSSSPKSVLRVSQARPSQFILTIPQYTSIAKHFVDKAIAVPSELLRILDRCIQLRNRCATLHATRVGEQSGDDGHWHFVSVLDSIRDMLAPLVVYTDPQPTSATKVRKREGQRDAAAGVTDDNRFSGLEAVEDLADIEIPAPPSSGVASQDTFGVEVTIEEAEIRALAFFSDIQTLRDHLQSVWRDYKEGRLNLLTASIVSNSALVMVRKSCDDMTKHVVPLFLQSTFPEAAGFMQQQSYDHEGDPGVMIIHLTELLHEKWSASPNKGPSRSGQAGMPKGAPVAFTMARTWGHLRSFLLIKMDRRYSINHFSEVEYVPSQWTDDNVEEQEVLLCKTTLLELLHLVGTCIHMNPFQNTFSVQNCHFVRAIGESLFAGKVSLLAIIATQFWLDCHALLGPDIPKVRADMRQHLAGLQESINRFETFAFNRLSSGQLKPKSNVGKDQVKDVERLQRELELWLNADPLDKWRRGTVPDKDFRSTILDCHPTLCGLIAFDMYMQYHTMGKQLMHERNMLVCTTYTLNALAVAPHSLNNSQRMPKWADLQHLLSILGRDDVQVSASDIDLLQQCRNLNALLGHSPATVTSYIRYLKGIGPEAPRPTPICNGRGSCSCRVNHVFNNWPIRVVEMVKNPAHTCEIHSFSLRDLQLMLKRIAEKTTGSEIGHGPGADGGHPRGRSGSRLRRAKKHKSDKFSIAQMLSLLEIALTTDADELYFDLIDLYMTCSDIMRRVFNIRYPRAASQKIDIFSEIDLRNETQSLMEEIFLLGKDEEIPDRRQVRGREQFIQRATLIGELEEMTLAIGAHLEGRDSKIMGQMKRLQEGYFALQRDESDSSEARTSEAVSASADARC